MRLYVLALLFVTMFHKLASFHMRVPLRRVSFRRLAHTIGAAKGEVQIFKGKEWFCEKGDPLIFCGAIERIIGEPNVGDDVLVKDYLGKVVGRGVYNPHSMYRVRVLAFKDDKHIDASFADLLKSRIYQAVSARGAMMLPRDDTDVFRLVNSEGDRLSGLVIDVIGSTVVVQSSALWVERQKDSIEAVLRAVPQFKRKTVLWRRAFTRLNQDGLGELEPSNPIKVAISELSAGDAEDSDVVTENGVKYRLCVATDQKTGFYCDQRDNRLLIRSMSKNKSVLDAYCYTGGFTLNAMTGGAARVTSIDSSARAIESLTENLALNGFASFNGTAENLDTDSASREAHSLGKVELVKGEADRTMQEMVKAGRTFDVVICDPPKLAPKRADLPRALRKYKQINTLAMQMVSKKGGLLLTCTCSAAMTQSGKFEDIVASAAKAAGRDFTVVRKTGAASDHTTVVGCPESQYLTALLLYVY